MLGLTIYQYMLTDFFFLKMTRFLSSLYFFKSWHSVIIYSLLTHISFPFFVPPFNTRVNCCHLVCIGGYNDTNRWLLMCQWVLFISYLSMLSSFPCVLAPPPVGCKGRMLIENSRPPSHLSQYFKLMFYVCSIKPHISHIYFNRQSCFIIYYKFFNQSSTT